MEKEKRFLIADSFFLCGLGMSLSLKHDFYCHTQLACSSKELVIALRMIEFDVIITAVNLPDMNSTETMSGILEIQPNTKLIFIGERADETDMLRKFRNGAQGYITREIELADLAKIVQRVIEGCSVVTHLELPPGFNRLVSSGRETNKTISARENEILKLICAGLRSRDIADKLFIAESTVKNHRHNLMKKTGSANLTELFRFAMAKGLLSLIHGFLWIGMGFGDMADVGMVMA